MQNCNTQVERLKATDLFFFFFFFFFKKKKKKKNFFFKKFKNLNKLK